MRPKKKRVEPSCLPGMEEQIPQILHSLRRPFVLLCITTGLECFSPTPPFPKKSYPPLPSCVWRGDEGILQTNLVWNWARRAYSSTRPKGGEGEWLARTRKDGFLGMEKGRKKRGRGGGGGLRGGLGCKLFNGNGGGRRGARESTRKMKRALENVSRSQEPKGGVPLLHIRGLV